MLDPDGLFARGLPIASTGLEASDVFGFCQRRFDLLAIMRLVMQSWFGYSYVMSMLQLLSLRWRRVIIGASTHHCPRNPRCLVGQRHRSDVRVARGRDAHHPGA